MQLAFYIGTDQHVHDFAAVPGHPWSSQDLTAVTGAVAAASGSTLTTGSPLNSWSTQRILTSITGQVLAGGSGLSGATISLTGTSASGAHFSHSATTNANGSYLLFVPFGGTYTITVSLSGYTFSPASQTLSDMTRNQTLTFTAAIVQPAVWTNYDGRLEIFYPLNGGIDHAWQQSAAVEQNWALNASLGGAIVGSPAVASNSDGRLELFAEGTDHNLYHNWQLTPGGNWSGWSLLANGPLSQSPSAVENSDGTLQVFAVINHVVYTDREITPENSSSWTGWTELGGAGMATTPSVIKTYAGDLYLFAQGTDSAAWYNVLSASAGTWSGWSSLGGSISGSPTAALNLDGRIQIFALGQGNIPYDNWEVTSGGAWSGWNSLGGTLQGTPAAVVNADGRIEIFGISGGTSFHDCQETPGGTWSGWNSLGGGNLNSAISVFRNVDGRVEIFDQTSNGAVWQNYQITPGGQWSGWYAINSASTPVAAGSITYSGFGTIGGPPSATESSAFWNFANKKQTGNVTPTQDINGWPKWNCAHVAVSFVGFPAKYNKALQRALDNWNKKLTVLGVTLGLSGPPVVFARDAGDGSHASVTVRYMTIVGDSGPLCPSAAQPVTKFTQGYTHLCTAQQVGVYIQHVNIDLNPNIQVAETITNVLAHEIGHTFQLADCDNCKFASVMSALNQANANSPFYSACANGNSGTAACAKQAVNFAQGASGPTSADIAAVAAINTQLLHCSNEAYNEPISCVDGSSPSVSEGFASDGTTGEPVTSCDGTVCDSCNAKCFSFTQTNCSGASTGGGSGGGAPACGLVDITCEDGVPVVCVDYMWVCDDGGTGG